MDIPEDDEVLDWMDPDWRERFIDAQQAADFYRQFSMDRWVEAMRECAS